MSNRRKHKINGVSYTDLNLIILKLIADRKPDVYQMAQWLDRPWSTIHKSIVTLGFKLKVEQDNHYEFYSGLIKHYNDNKADIDEAIERLGLVVPILRSQNVCQTKLDIPIQ